MPEQRMVDRNGMRAGAGISAVVLLAGFVFKPAGDVVVPIVAVALGIGAVFGLRYSPLGAIYRAAKKLLGLKVPVDPEEESPPRFAQLLGFVFLTLATLFLYATGSDVVGWTLALLVAGLQTLLAATGLCVGCEIYLYGKRIAAKGA